MSDPIPPFQHPRWHGDGFGFGFVLRDKLNPEVTRHFNKAITAVK